MQAQDAAAVESHTLAAIDAGLEGSSVIKNIAYSSNRVSEQVRLAETESVIDNNQVGEGLATYLYAYSWAAAKMVDLPVDDIWRNGRKWIGDDAPVEQMMEAIEKVKAHSVLSRAMKTARLYGTGAIVAFIDGDDPAAELDPAKVRKDSLKSLVVRNQHQMSVASVVADPLMEGYGEPFWYYIKMPTIERENDPTQVESIIRQLPERSQKIFTADGRVLVHASRVFRFDGNLPPTSLRSNTHVFDSDWGESVLSRALTAINRDATVHRAFGYLADESSIFAVSVDGFREMIKGRMNPGEPTVTEIASAVNKYKSIFRTMFMDADDSAERIAVSFQGAADMMDRFAARIASIADIPATRFLGKAPDGMNATGDGDNANYSHMLMSLRMSMLDGIIDRFDQMIAANNGMKEPPEFQWGDTFSLDPVRAAANAEKQSVSVITAFSNGLIDLDEARNLLPEAWYGQLGPTPTELGAMKEAKEEAELNALWAESEDDDDE